MTRASSRKPQDSTDMPRSRANVRVLLIIIHETDGTRFAVRAVVELVNRPRMRTATTSSAPLG